MMIKLFLRWFNRNFSDPHAVVLILLLVVIFAIILLLGEFLLPFFIAVVIAYLLDWGVVALEKQGSSRGLASRLVFVAFLALITVFLLILVPLIAQQISTFSGEIQSMVLKGQKAIMLLPQKYPDLFSEHQIQDINQAIYEEIKGLSQNVVSASLSSIVGAVTLLVYTILVPLLIYFLLKDKTVILTWCTRFLPRERKMAIRVWNELNEQIGNYVRGKVLEIVIVGVATYVVFAIFGLEYALLLSVLVGLSVVIPFVGATVVTIPIILVAYYQWGFGTQFGQVMIAYLIIQALDGNWLVPNLFSEVVNLHPVAIIVAVLFFGGIWGVWGVFFAIPLATLVKAVMSAWEDVRGIDDVDAHEEQTI